MRVFRVVSLVAVMTITAWGAAVDAAPPVFDSLPFDAARQQAATQEKLLLVDATAEWCGPCKEMDRTTWINPRVVEWLDERAIAIQVDVDAEPQVAEALRIEAMPTVVVFRDGEEFDRVVGYRDADELLDWLEGVARGERAIDRMVRESGEGDDIAAEDRMTLARALVHVGRFDEATDHYVWLWRHVLEHEPAMYGVRLSFMASEMRELADRHEPANERFIELRDQTEARLEGGERTWDDLIDWITLNDVVGDPERTLAWVDRVKHDDAGVEAIRRLSHDLDDLLVERGRWSDLAMVYADPVEAVEREARLLGAVPRVLNKARQAELRQWCEQRFREQVGRIYAAHLAAGNEDGAAAAAERAIEQFDDPQTRRALVAAAMEANQPRPVHRVWLAPLTDTDEEAAILMMRLDARLGPRE